MKTARLNFNGCETISDIHKKIWRNCINKDYSKLQIFFTKEIVYKKLRGIKRKIFK